MQFENIWDLMKRGSQHTYSQKLIAFGLGFLATH